MANFTAYCARIRSTPPQWDGERWASYLQCDVFALDENGDILPFDGSTQELSWQEAFQSLEPIELGDDQADFRRKAAANVPALFTQTIDMLNDTLDVVWIDAV